MIRAVVTIARRDIAATILSKGFLIWLAMPVIGLVFGVLASLATGRDPAPVIAVAVIDPAGDFAPWLQAADARERTRNGYERLRNRWAAANGGAAFPADLARPSALLADKRLAELADGGLDRIEAAYNLMPVSLDASGAVRTAAPYTLVSAEGDAKAQAARLLRPSSNAGNGRFGAVLFVDNGHLRLFARGGVDTERVRYLAGLAWTRRAFADAGLDGPIDRVRAAQPDIEIETVDAERANMKPGRGSMLATGAATVLFALISLLAGALLSNMVEEKANKIIEVLVASVPIPAIYAGKLIAMLIVSLIGVTVWGLMFGGAAAFAIAQLPAGLIPVPERGWPGLLALGMAYFVCAYLIYGAIYLGIGSLCSSIREVQTLSLPVTILQMVILIVTLGALDRPGSLWGDVVSWFPLSAPYMMAGRAATGTGLGVHLAAIAWQLGFAAFVILASSRLFRYGVLHSGPPPSLRQLFGLASFRRRIAT